MSVLRSFMTGDPALLEKPILLIYGNRLEAQMIDLSKMMDLHLFKQLSIQAIVTEPSNQWTGLSGVMNTENLRKACQVFTEKNIDLKNAQFLVCGPAEMIDAVERSLAEMDISLNQIESEKFQYDFSQNNVRNRLSLILMSLSSCALIASAVYLAK
jgi:ferredoxin-NADP reductase